MTFAKPNDADRNGARTDAATEAFPLLAKLFGASRSEELPPLVQQGLSVLEPALQKHRVITTVELEQSLVMQIDRHRQFEDCAAAGFVAIALFAQMEHVPGDVRAELNSLLELTFSKLEQKLT